MSSTGDDLVFDLMAARARIELLEERLSEMLHLFYVSLTWILAIIPPEAESRVVRVIRLKILQMPQGCPLGQRLIELDEQSGGLLESKGILLSRWVYEPRGRCNG